MPKCTVEPSSATLVPVRRKVIQHFANMMPQRFLDPPSGYDLAAFAHFDHGIVVFDILHLQTTVNGDPCDLMRTCEDYRQWLLREMARHHVPIQGVIEASMEVTFEVRNYSVRESFGHMFRSADFVFNCASTISTDEKRYFCALAGAKRWSYDWYWEKLFGSP